MSLTERQREILAFIESQDSPPTAREIAAHFGFKTAGTVAQYIEILRQKGFLARGTGLARSLKPTAASQNQRSEIAHIPLYGSIPAGFSDERHQQADAYVSIDRKSLGFKPTRTTYALRVKGDSMIEKHILDGDIAILDHGTPARTGDVVAALIDNESTLKVLVKERGKAFLRAANSRYKDLVPATELVIQGVMIGLLRSCRSK